MHKTRKPVSPFSYLRKKKRRGKKKKAVNLEDLLVQVLQALITLKVYVSSDWFKQPKDEEEEVEWFFECNVMVFDIDFGSCHAQVKNNEDKEHTIISSF